MEHLFNIQTYLLAGMIEVLYLNFFVGEKDIAVLVGGERVARTSNIVSTIVILIVAIASTISITWWYFMFAIVLFVIVGLSNIIVYPILKLVGYFLWSVFAPSHFVISESYEQSRGEIIGCRFLSLIYSFIGGGFLLYRLFIH